jgi:hypothetical protein
MCFPRRKIWKEADGAVVETGPAMHLSWTRLIASALLHKHEAPSSEDLVTFRVVMTRVILIIASRMTTQKDMKTMGPSHRRQPLL